MKKPAAKAWSRVNTWLRFNTQHNSKSNPNYEEKLENLIIFLVFLAFNSIN